MPNPDKENTTVELIHPDKQGVRTVDKSEVPFYSNKGWTPRGDVKPGGAELTPKPPQAGVDAAEAKRLQRENEARELNADAEAAKARAENAAGPQGGADPNAGGGGSGDPGGEDPSAVDAPPAADGASVADDTPQGATDQPTG